MDKLEKFIFNMLICMWIGMVLGMEGGMIWVIVKYSADENITQNSPLCNNTQ